jgi:hypothetical protein
LGKVIANDFKENSQVGDPFAVYNRCGAQIAEAKTQPTINSAKIAARCWQTVVPSAVPRLLPVSAFAEDVACH